MLYLYLNKPLGLTKWLKWIYAGIHDFKQSLQLGNTILSLGWDDVCQRYVRTFLGPLWLTIGTAVWIGAMSLVMGSIFNHPWMQTLPFIAVGAVLWVFIATTMQEGCTLFINAANIIHAINLPLSIHLFRLLIRNLIIFLHNMIILAIIFIICHVHLTLNTLWAIPGLFVLCLNTIWITCLLGILNSRYRDIQQLVNTGIGILPFFTPIFWEKSALKQHLWIAYFNPFYHAIEVIRAPLLGQAALLSWQWLGILTPLGLLLMFCLFTKYKHKIIYWV